MSFLSELWNKLKTPHDKEQESDVLVDEDIEPKNTPQGSATTTDAVLKNFAEQETQYLQSAEVLQNLKALKAVLEGPKEHNLDERTQQINQLLGIPESYEALRQERWDSEIQCPNCRSTDLKRIYNQSKTPHNHHYRCLECLLEFNDETGTPIETGIPPINIWMQCWYLMGCTDSLLFIAQKLNLDLPTVQRMIEQLKRIFQSSKPQTNSLEFEDWEKKSKDLRKLLNEDLMKQFELLDANVATTPKDSSEFRRQQNLRRNLKASTDPVSPTTAPNFTRKR